MLTLISFLQFYQNNEIKLVVCPGKSMNTYNSYKTRQFNCPNIINWVMLLSVVVFTDFKSTYQADYTQVFLFNNGFFYHGSFTRIMLEYVIQMFHNRSLFWETVTFTYIILLCCGDETFSTLTFMLLQEIMTIQWAIL